MKSNKLNFTKKAIEALPKAPTGKRLYFRDTKMPGLELMVTETGAKSFKVYRKVKGRPIRVTLGKFPRMSVENAREEAFDIHKQLNDGKNPNIEKRKISNEITLGQLLDKFINEYSRIHKRSWKEDEEMIQRHLGQYQFKKLSTFDSRLITQIHHNIAHKLTERDKKQGRTEPKFYAANRVFSLLRVAFNKAIEWGWSGDNPCNNVKAFKEKSRDRFIQPTELPEFFKALEQEQNQIAKDYIYISLLTGARKNNVLSMRWNEINFESAHWRIPETKNGEPLTIPLATDAIEILRKRKKQNDKLDNPSKFVFSGTGKTGHLQDPKSAWKRVLAKAGIDDLRIHDLRRSLGSYQAIMGANSYTIGKSLGHKSQSATAIYARLNLDPVRASVQLATDEIMRFRK